jgi:hypothetical protein
MLNMTLRPVTSHKIHYSIESLSQGIHLRIWEPKSATPRSPRPFMFAMNYMLQSEEEAYDLLEQYLIKSGANPLQVSPGKRRGELTVVAEPTEMHSFTELEASIA